MEAHVAAGVAGTAVGHLLEADIPQDSEVRRGCWMVAAQRRDSQDCRRGWSSWKSAVVESELEDCMVAVVERVVVRSPETADIAAAAGVAGVAHSPGMVEVQVEAAGNAVGSSAEVEHLLAGDPVAGVAGVDLAGVAGVDLAGEHLEAGRTATRAAEEAEQTEDMIAAAAEEGEVQEEEEGNAAPSGEVVPGDLAAVVAELAEAQEGEAGNTAPPELGSGAPRSWTWFLKLLMPYSILQRQFDESIVDSLSVKVM